MDKKFHEAPAFYWLYTLLIEHPGFDTPEARAIGHLGYYDVAADRAATA
mgnify:CR=1 FL=1